MELLGLIIFSAAVMVLVVFTRQGSRRWGENH